MIRTLATLASIVLAWLAVPDLFVRADSQAWVRVELAAPTVLNGVLWPKGTEVCKEPVSGALYPASPYTDKKQASQATAACNTLMPFLAWLGTADAQPGVFPGRLPPNISNPPPPTTLPSPWTQNTIGSGTGGNAVSSASILTDSCKGLVDFTADSGNFVHQPKSGDQEMVGRLDTIVADDVWSRYVPVVRQSTAAGSKYAGFFFDHRTAPGGFTAFNWRTALDGHNAYVGFDTAWTSPQFWRITRVGDVFSGYLGPTSTGPWTLNGSQSVVMSDPVEWGVLCENGGGVNFAVQTSLLPTINALGGGATGTVQFTSGDESINENGSALTISLSRAGGSTGAGSAIVSRVGTSTAVLTTDYTVSCALPCTLNWSGGDTANKTFTVTPVNRAGSQPSRHLDLSIGSPSGVTVGSPSTKVITINDVSSGAATKWRTGVYANCYEEMPHGKDSFISIGNPEYVAAKNCIDYWAAQGVVGVVIPFFWSSFEGNTPGSYDGTVGNGLDVAGKIGYPLFDDLTSYIASKGLKFIVGLRWFTGGQGDCNFANYYSIRGFVPAYLIQNTCGIGTDASGTYGVSWYPSLGQTNDVFINIWKAAVMDRLIAMLQAYGDRYDSSRTWEAVWISLEEGEYPDSLGGPGGSESAIETQYLRLPGAVKSHWAHTTISLACEWCNTASFLAEAHSSPTKTMGYMQNDVMPILTTSGQAGFLGLTGCGTGAPCWGNSSTVDYRDKLPIDVWNVDEVCGMASAGRSYPFWTPLQLYNAFYVNGSDDSPGHPIKPNRWALGRKIAAAWCPGSANQQWGTDTSGGFKQFWLTHSTNSTCPSDIATAGGCDTAP